ncbi:MAG: TipAS antibiotic-recognition domain-containing protein [Actinomycetes bacterium]
MKSFMNSPHHHAVTKWIYDCSVDVHKNLAITYVEEPRFKEYYDGRFKGLAQCVHDAIWTQ